MFIRPSLPNSSRSCSGATARSAVLAQRDAITQRGALSQEAAAAREKLRSVRGAWAYMDEQEKRALVVSVIDKITITHGEVDIDYRF